MEHNCTAMGNPPCDDCNRKYFSEPHGDFTETNWRVTYHDNLAYEKRVLEQKKLNPPKWSIELGADFKNFHDK